MIHPDMNYLLARERQRDALNEAAHSRLVKEALSRPMRTSTKPRFTFSLLALALARGLSYVGEQMLNWSCRLEGRYRMLAGVEEPSPCS